ncbi:MAG: VOC family protein [Deltaproteobacteria bacterium]|nr:VOC family protein [Deltaproteobacteria bacterium]
MIEHVSLRCADPKRSRSFYEKALAPLGYTLSKRYGDSSGFKHEGRHDFWVTAGEVGTPTHLAFHAPDRESVRAFYQAAVQAGGEDNGEPGVRRGYGYAAFVLDPDGHNVEAVVWPGEERKPSRKTRKRATKH